MPGYYRHGWTRAPTSREMQYFREDVRKPMTFDKLLAVLEADFSTERSGRRSDER
jgi:hypothetical protein